MISFGKRRGLQRLATASGHFAMVAMDQRPPLAALIAKRRGIGVDQVSFEDMVAAKRLLAQAFGSTASAVLIDPNFGAPAALEVIPPSTGLIFTLEDHVYDETEQGRRSHSIANWTVDDVKRIGADAVKVLAWYREDAGQTEKEHQKTYVQTVGRACQQADIPFILELLTYPFKQSGEGQDAQYDAYSERRPELVIESVREFSRPEYRVDLMKLESPVDANVILKTKHDESGADLKIQEHFDEIGTICANARIPWVMLSAGATADAFERVLKHAIAAGAQGFLAGRTIWLDCLQSFPNLQRCESDLRESGGQLVERFSELLAKEAPSWSPAPTVFDDIKSEGDFTLKYGKGWRDLRSNV